MFTAQQGKTKPKYTLAEVLAITKGAYQSDVFAQVVGAA